jgi:hypothetical protein
MCGLQEVINNLDTQCQVKLCLGQIIVILLSKYFYRKVNQGSQRIPVACYRISKRLYNYNIP